MWEGAILRLRSGQARPPTPPETPFSGALECAISRTWAITNGIVVDSAGQAEYKGDLNGNRKPASVAGSDSAAVLGQGARCVFRELAGAYGRPLSHCTQPGVPGQAHREQVRRYHHRELAPVSLHLDRATSGALLLCQPAARGRNSSPPYRPTKSSSRILFFRIIPSSFKSLLPSIWELRSLKFLKESISDMTTAMENPLSSLLFR